MYLDALNSEFLLPIWISKKWAIMGLRLVAFRVMCKILSQLLRICGFHSDFTCFMVSFCMRSRRVFHPIVLNFEYSLTYSNKVLRTTFQDDNTETTEAIVHTDWNSCQLITETVLLLRQNLFYIILLCEIFP